MQLHRVPTVAFPLRLPKRLEVSPSPTRHDKHEYERVTNFFHSPPIKLSMATVRNHFSCNEPEFSSEFSSCLPRYSPERGIYTSKHAPLELPSDPFLDVVSHIFSQQHNGVSALVDSSSSCSISYSDLFPLVKSTAFGLHKMGVSQGDVVLLLIPNSIFYPIVCLGVLYLGAIIAPLNPRSHISEIRKQIAECGVSMAFTSQETVRKLQPLGIPVIGVPGNFKDLKCSHYSVFYNLVSGNWGWFPRPVIKQEDKAAILYSSGTTGPSKGVVLTHKNFVSMVDLSVRFEASQYDYSSSKNVYLAVLPMFHIYGLSLFAIGLLSLGSTIVVMKTFQINEVIKVIDKHRVTHFPVVPPILTALTKKVARTNRGCLQSLIQVSCGAAPTSIKSIEDFIHTLPNVDFIQGYGMTESTGVGARGFNTEKFRNYSSIGLLAPNMEAKVVDWNTGAFKPPGCGGELWLRGPSITRGYLNNEEATMSTIDKDGWLHTGDVAWFDQDGYIHLSDRLKDTIKYRGYQISPTDLEDVLILHPEIVDVAVIGVNDEDMGEIPIAFVVREVGSTLSEEAVIDYVAQQVSPYKKVRKVVFTDTIPRSAAGKILRRQLRKNYLTSEF